MTNSGTLSSNLHDYLEPTRSLVVMGILLRPEMVQNKLLQGLVEDTCQILRIIVQREAATVETKECFLPWTLEWVDMTLFQQTKALRLFAMLVCQEMFP